MDANGGYWNGGMGVIPTGMVGIIPAPGEGFGEGLAWLLPGFPWGEGGDLEFPASVVRGGGRFGRWRGLRMNIRTKTE